MILTLTRFAYLPTATLGHLILGNHRYCTLEEPYLPNPAGPGGLPLHSCVPDGDYTLEPHNSADHPNTWALVNPALAVYHRAVPWGQHYGRSAVLIHAGNTTKDTEGCIIVGERFGSTDNSGWIDSVVDSRVALADIQASMVPGTHQLQIRPYPGTGAPLWGT